MVFQLNYNTGMKNYSFGIKVFVLVLILIIILVYFLINLREKENLPVEDLSTNSEQLLPYPCDPIVEKCV